MRLYPDFSKVFMRVYVPHKNQITKGINDVIPGFCLSHKRKTYLPLSTEWVRETRDSTFVGGDFSLDRLKEVERLAGFDRNTKTILFLHGYMETPDSLSSRTIAHAYLRRGDTMVFLLDWSMASIKNHLLKTLKEIMRLGPLIAAALEPLRLQRLHAIGFSYGAHLAAIISRHASPGLFHRITGLDPATIIVDWEPYVGAHLNKEDARFVDVIHTDAYWCGSPLPVGHADFYPNKGLRWQPGCPLSAGIFNSKGQCSHEKSWKYYAESVYSEKTNFIAAKCNSWRQFTKGRLTEDKLSPMGFHASPSSTGIYYLQTNGHPPYGRGNKGIKYEATLH